MAISFFDTRYLLCGTFMVDTRGVQDAVGVLAVRTLCLPWTEELYENFLHSKMSEAKILVIDTGCEAAWREFTVTEEDVDMKLDADIERCAYCLCYTNTLLT